MKMWNRTLAGVVALGLASAAAPTVAQEIKIGVSIPAATHGWAGGLNWHAAEAKRRLEAQHEGLEIVIAAVLSFAWGAASYGVLSKPWMKAARITPTPGQSGMMPGQALLINSIVCELIMAWVLAGIIGHLGPGEVTFSNGVVSAVLAWLGFVITTLSVNHAFQGAKRALTLIDGGHWLGVLLLQGAVIGLMGV